MRTYAGNRQPSPDATGQPPAPDQGACRLHSRSLGGAVQYHAGGHTAPPGRTRAACRHRRGASLLQAPRRHTQKRPGTRSSRTDRTSWGGEYPTPASAGIIKSKRWCAARCRPPHSSHLPYPPQGWGSRGNARPPVAAPARWWSAPFLAEPMPPTAPLPVSSRSGRSSPTNIGARNGAGPLTGEKANAVPGGGVRVVASGKPVVVNRLPRIHFQENGLLAPIFMCQNRLSG